MFITLIHTGAFCFTRAVPERRVSVYYFCRVGCVTCCYWRSALYIWMVSEFQFSFGDIHIFYFEISRCMLLLPCSSLDFKLFYRSHNFRPSFMRLRASLLHKRLNVGSVLAMTATATTTTLDAIISALDIPRTNLIQKAQLRDNFHLSVSMVKNRQVRCCYLLG